MKPYTGPPATLGSSAAAQESPIGALRVQNGHELPLCRPIFPMKAMTVRGSRFVKLQDDDEPRSGDLR